VRVRAKASFNSRLLTAAAIAAMPRRTRSQAHRPWLLAGIYAAGLWPAAYALAASPHLLMSGAQLRQLGVPGHPAWPLLALLAAACGSAGFAAGWLAAAPRHGPAAPRTCALAGIAGVAFPWLSGLLLPLFAWLRAVPWPLLAWCVVGSAMMAVRVARATAVPRKVNP